MAGSNGNFYYCLKHRAVEGAEGCRSEDRLGPYATQAEAEAALTKVAERNETWDNDPKWNDTDEARPQRS
jgi:hypothetical protein